MDIPKGLEGLFRRRKGPEKIPGKNNEPQPLRGDETIEEKLALLQGRPIDLSQILKHHPPFHAHYPLEDVSRPPEPESLVSKVQPVLDSFLIRNSRLTDDSYERLSHEKEEDRKRHQEHLEYGREQHFDRIAEGKITDPRKEYVEGLYKEYFESQGLPKDFSVELDATDTNSHLRLTIRRNGPELWPVETTMKLFSQIDFLAVPFKRKETGEALPYGIPIDTTREGNFYRASYLPQFTNPGKDDFIDNKDQQFLSDFLAARVAPQPAPIH